MENKRIVTSAWPTKDKIGMIFANNIDWYDGEDACVSMKKCNKLSDEVIELIEYEKTLNPMFRKLNIDNIIELKIGDFLLVVWSDFFVKHHPNSERIMLYSIKQIKVNQNEIILDIPWNHYFNYKMYLGLDTPGANTSQAQEVYLINKKFEVEQMRKGLYNLSKKDLIQEIELT